jgi:hypothetical protein
VPSRLLSCVFSVCRSAQCCLVLGRKLQIGTWISTSGPPPGRLLRPNREPGAQGTMTDPFGRPPTWFLFHVDRESSGVLYARSRTIWRYRYVRAFGSRSRIEGTSRIGSYAFRTAMLTLATRSSKSNLWVVSTSMSAPPRRSGWTSPAAAARPSIRVGLITSRWIGWRASRWRAVARCWASAGSQRQNTSVHPWNSCTARARRSRRHQPSATAPGEEFASRKTTSAAASPMRSDQSSSPNPRTSASASLIWSRLSSGSCRRSARADASVDFPVPGAPDTTTVRDVGMPTECRWRGVAARLPSGRSVLGLVRGGRCRAYETTTAGSTAPSSPYLDGRRITERRIIAPQSVESVDDRLLDNPVADHACRGRRERGGPAPRLAQAGNEDGILGAWPSGTGYSPPLAAPRWSG